MSVSLSFGYFLYFLLLFSFTSCVSFASCLPLNVLIVLLPSCWSFPNQPSLSMNSPVSPLSLDYTLLQTQTAGDTTVAQSFLLYFFNIHLLDTCRWCIVV